MGTYNLYGSDSILNDPEFQLYLTEKKKSGHEITFKFFVREVITVGHAIILQIHKPYQINKATIYITNGAENAPSTYGAGGPSDMLILGISQSTFRTTNFKSPFTLHNALMFIQYPQVRNATFTSGNVDNNVWYQSFDTDGYYFVCHLLNSLGTEGSINLIVYGKIKESLNE